MTVSSYSNSRKLRYGVIRPHYRILLSSSSISSYQILVWYLNSS